CLNPVDDDVENGLLHQVDINFDGQTLLRHVKIDGNTVLPGIGSGQLDHVFQQPTEVDFLEVKVARSGEVDQRLYDAIQTPNFAVDDVHVAARVGLLLGQFVLQQLQMEYDRIDGIFHFVGHAAGEAAAG